ncbi:alpha-amylase family glycosyl hydrolase [Mycoplasma struthionis]|uniref:Glycosyl hydrolase family 13 catalytic domain-containing protein n=1 Tax=Mycoplasma struthionis TaxID=538220 RepID=A0A3G8LHX6_9MOLU|nr:alpha-amylase family glycosyl hydrolase [Mycoplasma struthionis]AZG68835.1 hypothetical protein EGN60_02640 [Mycoplasma struthionis]
MPLNYQELFNQFKLFINQSNVILALGSDQVGRITSRWGSENSYLFEAIKTFNIFLMSSKNSIAIYYGDEFGILRAKIPINYQFNNPDFNEEKRFIQTKNISKETYYLAQSYQNKWTSHTWMAWNNSYCSGASNRGNGNIFNSIDFQNNNVENQLNNKYSALNFFKKSIRFIFYKYKDFFLDQNTKIEYDFSKEGYIKIFHKNLIQDKSIIFIINLSKNSLRSNHYDNNYKILLTTYANKFYASIPEFLMPYESLVLISERKQ